MQSSHRFTFLSLILFLLIFGGAIYYVHPLWQEVDVLTFARNESQQKKDELTQKLQDLKKLQQDIGQGSEVAQQSLLNAIPERLEEDKLITDITTIAEKNDIVLNAINFNVANNSLDKIKRAGINVNLSGDEDHLIPFLKGIETNQRKLVVKSITVQQGKVTDAKIARVNFSLNIETYYQKSI